MLRSLLLFRAVLAQGGTDRCDGEQGEVSICNIRDCEETKCQDCIWGEWMDYTPCTCEGLQDRHRSIQKVNNNCGKPCTGPRVDTRECVAECQKDKVKCEMEDWSAWTSCDKDCGGGQSFRVRQIKTEAEGGGIGCSGTLKETTPCNAQDCFPPRDCKLADWSEWSGCSKTCDVGQQERHRDIVSLSQHGGKPCEAKLNQVRGCQDGVCHEVKDCEWGPFGEWSACSQTCGGGNMSRSRMVNVAPRFGGKLCDAQSMSEVTACATDPCGIQKECKFDEWNEWDACSCSCNGMQHRVRHIANFPEHLGTPCEGGLREERPCNEGVCEELIAKKEAKKGEEIEVKAAPQPDELSAASAGEYPEAPVNPGPADCVLGEWDPWSPCSTTCSIGIKKRVRIVTQNPTSVGGVCSAALEEIEGCVEDATCGENPNMGMERVDCLWTEWDDYGACSASCGGGEKVRQRQISRVPNVVGTPCDAKPSMEVTSCNLDPCDCQNCEWRPWSEWGACTCTGLMERHRSMVEGYFDCGIPCEGPKAQTKACHPDCLGSLVDCEFEVWSDWTACTVECGGGQRERHRSILKGGSRGGQACSGAQKSMDACNIKPCEPSQDCMLSDWAEWSQCSRSCGGGQQVRGRHVKMSSTNGGVGCTAGLGETRECNLDLCSPIANCKWGEWEEWGACSKTCGSGEKTRTRDIITAPRSGGKLCEEKSKEEVAECVLDKCPSGCIDALWGGWSDWGPCSASCGAAFKYRFRAIIQSANYCGVAGTGKSQEFEKCPDKFCDSDVLDCKFQEWSEWGDCSCSCNGIKERNRQVESYPENGGAACAGSLKQAEPCNVEACQVGRAEDCVLNEWQDWTMCDHKCNGGLQTRDRSIKNAPKFGGEACAGGLKEVQMCGERECSGIIDCKWGEWQEWGACSTDCGGGEKTRFRHITQMAHGGGQVCDTKASTEVDQCNIHSCGAAAFCAWTEWDPWSSCTKTCGDGESDRKRFLQLRSVDDSGGAPPEKEFIQEMEMQDINLHTVERLGIVFCSGALSSALLLVLFARLARRSRDRVNLTLIDPAE